MDARVGTARLLVIGAVVASVAACGSLAPHPSPLAAAGGADGFLLAEGDGPGGPWSYWVGTSHCVHDAGMRQFGLWQWVESPAVRGGVSMDVERCIGVDTREQPYVVELSGVSADGVSFVYGQTRTDVVRVTVRLVDGREFVVETVAAPVELGWNARLYVAALPVDFSMIDTVRGYDASGQYVGGNMDAGETGPPQN